MKRQFKLENLDCANCAAKMERAIAQLPGVENVKVNFLTQKLTLEAEEARYDEILRQAAQACRRVEPACTILILGCQICAEGGTDHDFQA